MQRGETWRGLVSGLMQLQSGNSRLASGSYTCGAAYNSLSDSGTKQVSAVTVEATEWLL